MKQPQSPGSPLLRTLCSLALLVAPLTACVVGDEDDLESRLAALPERDCAGLAAWAQNTSYRTGDLVVEVEAVFSARVSHTAFASNWNPTSAASLWLPVARCAAGAGGDGGGGGGEDPPAPPPDEEAEQDEPEEIPPPVAGCEANGRPGPLFDLAGVPNVGNGEGDQFIGGQCLSAADCASGCCALPCGICSGPGAQFQAGKQGCGFGD